MTNLPSPCLRCGTPVVGKCPECGPKETRTGNRSHPHLHTARWTRLSKRLRQQSPFCENCGSTEDLSVDHRVPASVRPDWIFPLPNLRVWCMDCQRSKGDSYTQADVEAVEQMIKAQRKRVRAI